MEFYYKITAQLGKKTARYYVVSLRSSKNTEIILGENDIFSAGDYKSKYSNLSIIDSMLAAISNKLNATILTTETPLTKIKQLRAIKLNY